MAKKKIEVKGREIKIIDYHSIEEYISLTDIARYKDEKRTDYLIQNWLRNRNTIEFLGIWERLNNSNFNPIEFDGIKNKSGLNSFVLTTKQWVERTNAIGLMAKTGRYGGTYAHKDIAFEFASWISVEFKLYMIKEFQRLQEKDAQSVEWNIKRSLSKINYRIHTDAIQKNLIPPSLGKNEISFVYATEADVLNMALFGETAKMWREKNPKYKGNIRDYANVAQLVCLSNLESINALLIKENICQTDRLNKLNEVAIEQMKILVLDRDILIRGEGKIKE